jgi:hypothetical protein
MILTTRTRRCATPKGRLRWALGVLVLGLLPAPVPSQGRPIGPGDGPENRGAEATPPLERIVSLGGEKKTRREALEEIGRRAGITLRLDEEALAGAGLDLDQPVTIAIADETLQDAIGRLIDGKAHPDVYRQVRGDVLTLSTLRAAQEQTRRHLPEWLKPLHGRGLIATVDEAGDVTALTCGDVMTDELLARLATLPKLRELELGATNKLTEAGIARLRDLPALEALRLSGVVAGEIGLGDAAIRAASRVPSLTELSVGECGTTDAGARLLEAMPQLTRLTVRQEGRLTDAALAPIATLKRLRSLDLSSYVATASHGRMRFSEAGLRPLAALEGLEELHLVGHAPGADLLLAFPKLTSLSVGEVGDEAAASIARCRDLQSLVLMYPTITDDGSRRIASLPNLRHLSLNSAAITDAGVAHLGASPRLEHLELRATGIGDGSLRHLARLKTLKRLDLHGSGLPGSRVGGLFSTEGLRQLRDLPALRTLSMTNLRLEGGWSALADLGRLRVLSLMMTDIWEAEVEALEKALPNTTIHAMTGAGRVAR